MKKLLALVLAATVTTTGSASADGGGTGVAHVLVGRQGVTSPDGAVRYVALTTGRQTIVSVVRVRGGQIVRWRLVRGYLGVPVVTLDGRTEGISRDGRTLVLAGAPGGATARFAVMDTRSLRLRLVKLRGSWSFDALSPDGRLMYLIQYTTNGPSTTYRVRAYDVAARRLFTRPIVDRQIGERLMLGWAVTRATTPDGRWAYTLYARAKKEPFVHALDTLGRQAYCIDLPLELARAEQMALRLGLRGERLHVRRGAQTVVSVDTRTFIVHRH